MPCKASAQQVSSSRLSSVPLPVLSLISHTHITNGLSVHARRRTSPRSPRLLTEHRLTVNSGRSPPRSPKILRCLRGRIRYQLYNRPSSRGSVCGSCFLALVLCVPLSLPFSLANCVYVVYINLPLSIPTFVIGSIYLRAKPAPGAPPRPTGASAPTTRKEKFMDGFRFFCNGMATLDWVGTVLALSWVTCCVVRFLLHSTHLLLH